MIRDLQSVFERELATLKKEIASYSSEAELWAVGGEVSNSAGNLCLHLIGNLNHFIGRVIGGTDYIREREKEFQLKDVPRAELLERIDQTIRTVKQSLEKLSDRDLAAAYPLKVLATETSTGFFLLHLVSHLNYHLGQINYHRRLISSARVSIK